MPINLERTFRPVRAAVLTISDTRTPADDKSGDLLEAQLRQAGHAIAWRRIVRDERAAIVAALREAIADPAVDLLLSTGGTGLTGRDVTPEAFLEVADKEIPGFGELFRAQSYAKIGSSTIQSRALGIVAEGTYLFALPGSPGACRDAWEGILRDQLDSRQRPCNLVQLMPRLREGGD